MDVERVYRILLWMKPRSPERVHTRESSRARRAASASRASATVNEQAEAAVPSSPRCQG
jgi:hypothetical protein